MKPTIKDSEIFSLDSLGFLIRHPWCFIYPFVLICCMAVAQVIAIPSEYRCEAFVSFGVGGGESPSQKINQRREYLTAKVFLGDNIKGIIGRVWPGVTEQTNPIWYNILMNRLRSGKGGIEIDSSKSSPGLVGISFTSSSPAVCYRVVQATIETIKIENRKTVEESVDSAVRFLTRQLNLYRDKLSTIDGEILKASAKLRDMATGLNVEQRELVFRITDEQIMQQQGDDRAVAGGTRNINLLADLEMKLIETKNRKQLLQMRIDNKDFTSMSSGSQDLKDDVFARAVEEKKLAMFELVSRGCLPDHPDVKRLQKGISDLNALREKQMQEMADSGERELSDTEKKLAEQVIKKEAKELDYSIGILQEQVGLAKKYSAALEKAPVAEEALVGPAANEASRLRELRDERSIFARYYNDLRKQLEETDLRGRAEKADAAFVVEVVEPPTLPVSPLRKKTVNKFFLGLVFAIGTGAGLSYLVDSMDKSIRSAAALREMFQIPVLASIDRISTIADRQADRARRMGIIISIFVISVVAMAGVLLNTILHKV